MKNSLSTCLLFFVIISPFLSAASSGNALDVLLKSTSISERRSAYLDILNNADAYVDQILLGINNWQKTKDQGIEALNKLIYLAAVLKRDEFIKPLENIAEDTEYTEHECIYSCPVIFSLAVFAVSMRWTPPVHMVNFESPYLLNLHSLIGQISLVRDHPGSKFARAEDRELLSKTESLTEEELIQCVFRGNPAGYSDGKRPPFRAKPATHSDGKAATFRPVVGKVAGMARKIRERGWVISGKPGIFRLLTFPEGGEDAGQEVTDAKDERGPSTEMGVGTDVPAGGGEPGLGPLDCRRVYQTCRGGGAQLALASRL